MPLDFEHTLEQLDKDDRQLHDFLIMCCYVHSCRVPVPYSLASAFLGDSLASYEDFQAYIERLRSVVLDYTGSFIDSKEDHFVPRSTLFAETILQHLAAPALKRVLLRFHRDISPVHVCRYDVFRRFAFDAQLAKKAFLHWEEGRDFYQALFEREGSPYIRQQGALYLSHRKRYREAFAWIDEARDLSRGKVFSIRNSYAIILFRANIDAEDPHSDKVRQTLGESMSMLSECYRYDLRKQYHALTFGDQALKFCEIYWDQDSREYLLRASTWIDVEYRKDPHNRSIHRLRRAIARRLREFEMPSVGLTQQA